MVVFLFGVPTSSFLPRSRWLVACEVFLSIRVGQLVVGPLFARALFSVSFHKTLLDASKA